MLKQSEIERLDETARKAGMGYASPKSTEYAADVRMLLNEREELLRREAADKVIRASKPTEPAGTGLSDLWLSKTIEYLERKEAEPKIRYGDARILDRIYLVTMEEYNTLVDYMKSLPEYKSLNETKDAVEWLLAATSGPTPLHFQPMYEEGCKTIRELEFQVDQLVGNKFKEMRSEQPHE